MSKTHKICIVMGSHWAKQIGGAQYQCKCIIDELLHEGNWDIHYLATLVADSYVPTGYAIHGLGNAKRRKTTGSFIWDASKLTKTLRELDPDVVYQRGLKAHTGIIAAYCRSRATKFVFHVAHDDDVANFGIREIWKFSPDKLINRTVGRFGLRRANAVIAQTQSQSESLHRNFGIVADRIAPNFHPLPISAPCKQNDMLNVVWVANFKPTKQPELFVELAESMTSEPNIRFVMIGRGGDVNFYQGLHERIDVAPNLSYLGELSIEQVNEALSHAHVFVNTSTAEGFPNTFIQAWMRSVPVLSLNVDPDNVMKRERIGIMCGSVRKLRQALMELLVDSEFREAMGDRAMSWANSEHGPGAAKTITGLLGDLATEKSRHLRN